MAKNIKKAVKKTKTPVAKKVAAKKAVVKKAVKKVVQSVKSIKAVKKVDTKKVMADNKKINNVTPKVNACKPVDEAPLSKAELTEYRDKLNALKEEILGQIKEISEDTLSKSQTEATGENSAYTLDAASDNYDREFNFRLVSGDRELLLEIDAALKKIEGGDYGICIVCDKPIGRNRLSVLPYSRHCRQCKENLEKEGNI